jgi:hypothetical protein
MAMHHGMSHHHVSHASLYASDTAMTISTNDHIAANIQDTHTLTTFLHFFFSPPLFFSHHHFFGTTLEKWHHFWGNSATLGKVVHFPKSSAQFGTVPPLFSARYL